MKSLAIFVATYPIQVVLAAVSAIAITTATGEWSSTDAKTPTQSMNRFEIANYTAFIIMPPKVNANATIP